MIRSKYCGWPSVSFECPCLSWSKITRTSSFAPCFVGVQDEHRERDKMANPESAPLPDRRTGLGRRGESLLRWAHRLRPRPRPLVPVYRLEEAIVGHTRVCAA